MTECNKSIYLANKSIDMIDAVNKGYVEGYNKAIDDFVSACNKQFATMYGQRYIDMRNIKEIAEQLKGGGTDE